ncbi:GreA/GreB family elongation factor [Sunxiuqinia elliptica]|uniref:Regulator of nucleoside diphosphate kinase n=1 Tax=Sunxiuqinia elliptica TaxID=655355 RepID=A0A4R6HCN5_9BACT|nr:GreA/GreB family elongation factor [Sunxiuqinia elliptica]TDO05551.1 regulator of nucleoside diphosphate kinase [Sunxiuqinia elliptica]TDO65095.1 regulator of nucleoside diphosphate kinase [Sunxiuqinia elliptica]
MLISTIDFDKITQQLRTIEQTYYTKFEFINMLREKLGKAQKVPPQEIPSDVVTMNSVVQLKQVNTTTVLNMKLVYPEWENIREHKLSIFSALGIAVFLSRIGDEVTYSTWKKDNQIKILDIPFQPEANGHFTVKTA